MLVQYRLANLLSTLNIKTIDILKNDKCYYASDPVGEGGGAGALGTAAPGRQNSGAVKTWPNIARSLYVLVVWG